MVGSIKNRIAAFENMAVQSKSSGKIMAIVPPSPGFSATKKVGQMNSKGKEISGYVPLVTKPNGTNRLNGQNPAERRQLAGRDHRDQQFNEDLDIYKSFKMDKKKKDESEDLSEKENSHTDVDPPFSGPVNEVNVSSESERDSDEERNQQTISPLSFQGSKIDSTRESIALETIEEREPSAAESLDQIAEEEVAEIREDNAQPFQSSEVILLPLDELCDGDGANGKNMVSVDGANGENVVSDARSDDEKTSQSNDSGECSDPKAKSVNSINSETGNIINTSVASEDDPFADDFEEIKQELVDTAKDHQYFSDRAELIQADMENEKDFDLFISNDSTDDEDGYFDADNQDDDANSFTAYLEDLQPIPSTRNLLGTEMEPKDEVEPKDRTNEDHTSKATLPEELSTDSKCMTYSQESGVTNKNGADDESFGCENGEHISTNVHNLHDVQENLNLGEQELVAVESLSSKEIGDNGLHSKHGSLPESDGDLISFDDQNNCTSGSSDHHPFPSSSEIGESPKFVQTEHGESLVKNNAYTNASKEEEKIHRNEDGRNNPDFGDVFAENIASANELNREEAFPINQDGSNEMKGNDSLESFQQLRDSTHDIDMHNQSYVEGGTAPHFVYDSDEIKSGDNFATSEETRETFSDDDYDEEIIQNVYQKVDTGMNHNTDERILGLDEHDYVEIMDEADDDESALIGVEIDDESMASDSHDANLIKVFPLKETTVLRHDGNDYLKQPIQLTPIDECQDHWNEETDNIRHEGIQMQQNPPLTFRNPALLSQNDDTLSQITEDSYESESPAIKWELAETQEAAIKPVSNQSLMTYSVTTTSHDSIIENKQSHRPIFRQSNSLHQNKKILGKNPGIKLDPIISSSNSNISEITDPEQSFRKRRPTFPAAQERKSNREVVVLSTISGVGGKKSGEAKNNPRRRRSPSPFSRKKHSSRTNHSGGSSSTKNDYERGRQRKSNKKSDKKSGRFSIRSLSPFRKRKSKNEIDEISSTSAYKGPMSQIESTPRPRLARTPSEILEADEAKETIVPLVAITSSDDSSQFRRSQRKQKQKKKFSLRSLSPFRRKSKKSSRPDPFDEDGESV